MDQNNRYFRKKVYKIVSGIPSGKVATYGQVARLAGKPKAARAVGVFMKTNPDAPRIPCHRVVSSDGGLTGYSAGKGIETKRELLIKEKVKFNNGKVDLKKSQWQFF
jgi:O-6-methylguanine DNA methyltransferase